MDERGQDRQSEVLRLRLLAGFRAELCSRPISSFDWERPKAAALVKLLAVEPTHQLHRDQVIDLLWPDRDPAAASNSLRKALHLARHALEPELAPRAASSYLHLTGDLLLLDLELVWVDVDAFERSAEEALVSRNREALEAALALYAGELLPEDRYAEWTQERREHVKALHLRLLLAFAECLASVGDFESAAESLEAALRDDPSHEEVHRALMRLYALSGRRHDAMQQYLQCRRVLQEQFDLEPEAETSALYEQVRSRAILPATPLGYGAAIHLPAALRSEPRDSFVGRERPRRLLVEALTQGENGHRLTLIGGEAGVGKSRLAVEVAHDAARHGAMVLWGACHEHEGQIPYGPFIEALEGYLGNLLGAERDQFERAYPELATLLPSLPGPSMARGDREGEQVRLFNAVGRVLSDRAELQPVLLVLDDLHAADAASLQLLHHLVRQPASRAWAILATYREEDLLPGGELSHLITALSRTGRVRRIALLPLARAECDRLVDSLLPDVPCHPDLLERLFALSLGNPLFVTELVRDLRDRGGLDRRDDLWRLNDAAGRGDGPIPAHVREVIVDRVARMGEEVGHVLSLAAVAGQEVPYRVLAAALERTHPELTESSLLDALDAALEARILDERGPDYVFRHPLFRATLYHRLSQRRRMRLHRNLAHALETSGPDEVEALSYHYAHSDTPQRAIAYLARVGDRAAAVYAHDAAESAYRDAIERLDVLNRDGEAASVREKLALLLRTGGRYDEAGTLLNEAGDAYRRLDDLEGLGRVEAAIGSIYAFRGRTEDGVRRLKPLIASLEERGATAIVARLYAALANLFFPTGRYRECAEAAARAGELAREVGDLHLLAEAELRRGSGMAMVGHIEEGGEAMRRAVDLAEETQHLGILPLALNNLGDNYLARGRLLEARACLERGVQVARQVGDPVWLRNTTGTLGNILFHLGEWRAARACIEDVLTTLQPSHTGASWHHAYPLQWQGKIDVGEGRWEQADEELQEAISLARRAGDLQLLALSLLTLAELELERGCPERVAEVLAPFEDEVNWESMDPIFLTMLAGSCLQLGDPAQAEALANRAVEQLLQRDHQLPLADTMRVRAIAVAERDWEEADRLFAEAAAVAHDMQYPQCEARTLRAWAASSLTHDADDLAERRLRQSLEIFRALGARKDVERTESLLNAALSQRTS